LRAIFKAISGQGKIVASNKIPESKNNLILTSAMPYATKNPKGTEF
jgi:hypothetical protein